jgi:hypothetical protein
MRGHAAQAQNRLSPEKSARAGESAMERRKRIREPFIKVVASAAERRLLKEIETAQAELRGVLGKLKV